MKMEPIEHSETSASNTQTPGNYPKETVLHLQHGENSNLKSDMALFRDVGVMLTNQNSMHEKIQDQIKLRECLH
jgi:hypothetical protein